MQTLIPNFPTHIDLFTSSIVELDPLVSLHLVQTDQPNGIGGIATVRAIWIDPDPVTSFLSGEVILEVIPPVTLGTGAAIVGARILVNGVLPRKPIDPIVVANFKAEIELDATFTHGKGTFSVLNRGHWTRFTENVRTNPSAKSV